MNYLRHVKNSDDWVFAGGEEFQFEKEHSQPPTQKWLRIGLPSTDSAVRSNLEEHHIRRRLHWGGGGKNVAGAMPLSRCHRNIFMPVCWNSKMSRLVQPSCNQALYNKLHFAYTGKMHIKNNLKIVIMQLTKGAPISSWKCTKSVWRPCSAQTRWGSSQRSPDFLAGSILKGSL